MIPIRGKMLVFLCLTQVILWSQPSTFSGLDSIAVLSVERLQGGEQVRSSGQTLMAQPLGFTRIQNQESTGTSAIQVAVHGYGSEGYEWVLPMAKLSGRSEHTFFYRYDWDKCPREAAEELASSLISLIRETPGTEKLVLFGHSHGGIVVTFCAGLLHLSIPVEVHAIAAPLAGHPGLAARCDLVFDRDSTLVYPVWDSSVVHIQWKTQHLLDNAFNRLSEDPQEVNLSNSRSHLLPPTMDGHRLGHNWSVTWVVDEYLAVPHRR